MFLALLIFPLVSVFHILIHALFKSLLFLLAGSLIHIQSNFQSLYKMKLNNSLIKILFIAGVIVLIFSFSKEGIIHCSNSMYSSTFVYVLGFLCGMLTTIYSLKIYIYCFYLSYYGVLYSSFILPMLTITSILIDQCLDSCFSFCSLSLFFSLDFGELFSFSSSDSILHFSIISIFFSSIFFSVFFSPLMLLQIYLFLSSELSYFTFQLAFILFSTFFFKAPIHSIELFTGCSSCYCLYHIHYLTSFQYILFFISLILLLLVILLDRLYSSNLTIIEEQLLLEHR
jgi:NADH:ubiquinone oxidoreductase subunit 5 (subunit L)/multisubunit Na+/H+ antiporter MnhA subunit